jgi:hypothetical protein
VTTGKHFFQQDDSQEQLLVEIGQLLLANYIATAIVNEKQLYNLSKACDNF